MRAVLDPNVLIAALLSPRGAPAQIVSRWLAGEFELVVSESVFTELERALAYPKVRNRIGVADATAFIDLLRDAAILSPEPSEVPRRSADPGDDYLLSLAEQERAVLVSGDQHLLALKKELPVRTPREFCEELLQ